MQQCLLSPKCLASPVALPHKHPLVPAALPVRRRRSLQQTSKASAPSSSRSAPREPSLYNYSDFQGYRIYDQDTTVACE